MSEKLDHYDLLGILVPGLLLICWIPICFPDTTQLASSLRFAEAFTVVICTAIAVFLGHLIQAVASLVEPTLYRTWGGRPSDRALAGTLVKYLPKDAAERIKIRLVEVVGGAPSERSLFLHAMQVSDGASVGRVARFNSLYAYHRALLVLIAFNLLLFLASMLWGAANRWSWPQCVGVLSVLLLLLILFWNRTRQRACYYAREVLLTAERIHRDSATSAARTTKES
jgi:hypothetical protein